MYTIVGLVFRRRDWRFFAPFFAPPKRGQTKTGCNQIASWRTNSWSKWNHTSKLAKHAKIKLGLFRNKSWTSMVKIGCVCFGHPNTPRASRHQRISVLQKSSTCLQTMIWWYWNSFNGIMVWFKENLLEILWQKGLPADVPFQKISEI
jgi:hypothetical protein